VGVIDKYLGTEKHKFQVPGRLRFVLWCIIFVGPWCGSFFLSPSWHLEVWGGSLIFGKFVCPYLRCVHRTKNYLKIFTRYPPSHIFGLKIVVSRMSRCSQVNMVF